MSCLSQCRPRVESTAGCVPRCCAHQDFLSTAQYNPKSVAHTVCRAGLLFVCRGGWCVYLREPGRFPSHMPVCRDSSVSLDTGRQPTTYFTGRGVCILTDTTPGLLVRYPPCTYHVAHREWDHVEGGCPTCWRTIFFDAVITVPSANPTPRPARDAVSWQARYSPPPGATDTAAPGRVLSCHSLLGRSDLSANEQ